MRKVTVAIEEVITHRHDITIETDLSDEEIGKAFDAWTKKHRRHYFSDLRSLFKHDGIKVVMISEDEDGDPEMECTDVCDYVDESLLDDTDDDIHDGEDDEEIEDEDDEMED